VTLTPHSPTQIGILTPTGMLGGGFSPETVQRGLDLGADVITVDAGSTDSGPFYLGTGTAKTTAAAVAGDLRILLRAAAQAQIPLIIGSCGTSGTDSGVDWVAALTRDILTEENLTLRIATIYSEQRPADLVTALENGLVQPLAPSGPLEAATLRSCEHVVAMMGHEPIAEALLAGADVILAGRATDTALAAAYPLMMGYPAGPCWHAAKIVECGGMCTTNPRAGGVFAIIDADGFTLEPLDPASACTPQSVAAHMLYETVNPYQMREPAGTIIVTDATYTALDERRVRVEHSRFEPAEQYTNKLEGSAIAGYETMSFVGIRDPRILASIDEWAALFNTVVRDRVQHVLGLAPADYAMDLRLYGHNAILGAAEPHRGAPHEVGVMLLTRARQQATATAIAKVANPLLLHLPLPGATHLPSFAFATSPAETERGAAYEFVLNHVVTVDSPTALFRTVRDRLGITMAHA
jgi:hypothetical protein